MVARLKTLFRVLIYLYFQVPMNLQVDHDSHSLYTDSFYRFL